MKEKLIKSKERVKEFAEVYTPAWLVKAMCDLVDDEKNEGKKIGDIFTTVLEPACGNGNFLVEILERKLKNCKTAEDVNHALMSIYGVDIQADNIVEAKERMYAMLKESGIPFDSYTTGLILNLNIQQGDFLTNKKANGKDLIFIDWSKRNWTVPSLY